MPEAASVSLCCSPHLQYLHLRHPHGPSPGRTHGHTQLAHTCLCTYTPHVHMRVLIHAQAHTPHTHAQMCMCTHYTYIHAHTYAQVHTSYTHARVYVYAHYTHMYVHTRICQGTHTTHMPGCAHIAFTCVCIHYTHMHVCTHAHVHMFTCTCAHVHMYTPLHVCMLTYSHTSSSPHTPMPTHTHPVRMALAQWPCCDHTTWSVSSPSSSRRAGPARPMPSSAGPSPPGSFHAGTTVPAPAPADSPGNASAQAVPTQPRPSTAGGPASSPGCSGAVWLPLPLSESSGCVWGSQRRPHLPPLGSFSGRSQNSTITPSLLRAQGSASHPSSVGATASPFLVQLCVLRQVT